MTQQFVASSQGMALFASNELDVDDMKIGLNFKDEESGVSAILNWAEKSFCPLVKARRVKDLSQTGGQSHGKRYFECSHGRKKNKTYTPKGERPRQNVNFTKVFIVLLINVLGVMVGFILQQNTKNIS